MLAASQRNALLQSLNRQRGRALPQLQGSSTLQPAGARVTLINVGIFNHACVAIGLRGATRRPFIVCATGNDSHQEDSNASTTGQNKQAAAENVGVAPEVTEVSTDSTSNSAPTPAVTTTASDVTSNSEQVNEHSNDSTETADSTTQAKVAAEVTPVAAQSAPQQSVSTSASNPQASESASDSTWKKISAWFAAVGVFLASLIASIRQLPVMVQQQQLKRLRDASDDDPLDADKHAAYLQLLNKVSPKDVLTRVESKEFATNAAVVSEYLRALVLTEKLGEYSGSSAGVPGSPDEKTLDNLLRDLQAQVSGDAEAEAPGTSQRRPLHVAVIGGNLQPSASKPAGPLQAIWSLLRLSIMLVFLATAWLAGSQALSRVQVSQQAAVGAASIGSASGNGNSNSAGPSVDPKEYKKDELPEKSVKTFKDVRGCDEAKGELQEVVEFLKNPSRFTKLGAKLPKGVLLTGPPGTGKTLLARAVAGEAGVPFFYRAGSEFEELYVGVGSRRMRALFSAAKKKAPCIVFIDEIDAIGGNRKHWDNHTRKTLNQLLVEMDGFEANDGVIVMAATNLAETLDPALKRPGRFDRQVAVPLPDLGGRHELLEYYLQDKPVASSVDKNLLARQTQGFSGADISNLVNEAALLAAKQGADQITPLMLDDSFDKICMGVERKSVRRTPESIKRTAYHEAGHALLATSVKGASPVHKATIVPRGHALGMVSQVGRDDEFSFNKEQMVARIWVLMGGQVAEELIFGRDKISSGATDDLRQATELAHHMVAECGLSDLVGPVHVSQNDLRNGLVSEQLKTQIDVQIRQILVEAREGVKALMSGRIADLHRLAAELMDKETLTADQIMAVLSAGQPQAPGSDDSGGNARGKGDRHDDRDVARGHELEGGVLFGVPGSAGAAAEQRQYQEQQQPQQVLIYADADQSEGGH